jgi:hypothetical protein
MTTTLIPAHGRTDPVTSKIAAAQTIKNGTYRDRLLAQFAQESKTGLTSEEAAS